MITVDPVSKTQIKRQLYNAGILRRGLVYDQGRLLFMDLNIGAMADILYAYHPADGSVHTIGKTGLTNTGAFVDMAVDPMTGVLYAVIGPNLCSVDKAKGKVTILSQFPLGSNISALAFDSKGRLFAAASTSSTQAHPRIFLVHLPGPSLTELGNLPPLVFGQFLSIAFDGSDRLWGQYWSLYPEDSRIYRIDLQAMTIAEKIDLGFGLEGIAFGPAPQIDVYCTPKVSSQGCAPTLEAEGHPSPSATGGFAIRAHDVPNASPGLLLFGTGGPASIPFQGGTLCLAGALSTTEPVDSGGSPPPVSDCTGTWALDFNTWLNQHPSLPAGATVQAQWWGRESAGGEGLHSDAVEFTLLP